MPIRINLLAEDQAAEELRRRDPAKRAGVIAGLLVLLVLVWSGSLQLSIMRSKQELKGLRTTINSLTNEYQVVQAKMAKLNEAETKLMALDAFTSNRFLWAPIMNNLQQTVVEDVELIQFRSSQSFTMTEEVKATTNDAGRYIPGRPATSTEKISIMLEARDSGPNEGDSMLRYQEVLSSFPGFQDLLGRTNKFQLASRSQLYEDKDTGRRTVNFTLEAKLPERTR